ncbi:Protein lunapark-like protein [Hapsidospora chrysogenum ATCC 11550]|uniref:Endoplasmic reticulum junction formation protein lunapark n=1 Tax=Hapsidospora chrysogenum (strain ATCC 11550 / CBS 779.69 / DSM 880 / IAM 14645 / JCM 23072 / IMI 49137) TaxID=857340 RepID=A0A086SZN8_HAPC1|nr:Protein lunapark-like protein [Hapsidospora chrysogenum ATCC 11550]
MVSFWPWRGESSSTASFEKTLSTLSTKIADTQTRLDRVRSRSRRVKVLWTLYLGFAYLVYAIVLLLVVGYRNMGAYEWTGLAGGPVLIYGTRTLMAAYFNFRIESLSARLNEQQEERAKTIQKLKEATKYDSTLELIEKYGGAEGKSAKGKKKGAPVENEEDISGEGQGGRRAGEKKGTKSQGVPGRTSMGPPPTANIQRNPDGSLLARQPPLADTSSMEPGAEFAPNAEYIHPPPQHQQQQHRHLHHQAPPSPLLPQQHQPLPPESHWYDRIFDVLLGEDETAPKNRIVLICRACRLVNGQAPPGAKSLADVGMWRCMGCGTLNGETVEDEGQRIVREVLGESKAEEEEEGKEAVGNVSDSSSEEEDEEDGPAATVKKRRGKASR